MNQLAHAAGKPVADIAQRIRVRQLAKQHRDQLRPATETFRRPFGAVLFHQRGELRHWKMLQQLIKQTHRLYHRLALLIGDSAAETAWSKRWFGPEQL
jgi:hypothetical protein